MKVSSKNIPQTLPHDDDVNLFEAYFKEGDISNVESFKEAAPKKAEEKKGKWIYQNLSHENLMNLTEQFIEEYRSALEGLAHK